MTHNTTRFTSGIFRPVVATLLAFAWSTGIAQMHDHEAHKSAASAKLVQTVREATAQYIDVNDATAAGYGPFLGCVSGPDHGAMGIHYVNPGLVGDGEIDASHPEALIYEPRNGELRLVGVEFIVDAATWLKTHSGAPVL